MKTSCSLLILLFNVAFRIATKPTPAYSANNTEEKSGSPKLLFWSMVMVWKLHRGYRGNIKWLFIVYTTFIFFLFSFYYSGWHPRRDWFFWIGFELQSVVFGLVVPEAFLQILVVVLASSSDWWVLVVISPNGVDIVPSVPSASASSNLLLATGGKRKYTFNPFFHLEAHLLQLM